jgi:hypothetical protein
MSGRGAKRDVEVLRRGAKLLARWGADLNVAIRASR